MKDQEQIELRIASLNEKIDFLNEKAGGELEGELLSLSIKLQNQIIALEWVLEEEL
jgi:hypothetical protein